jgi:hypothetical protein
MSAAKLLTNKTCEQIAEIVYGYVAGKLSPGIKRDFDRHLRICPDCIAFLKTYKKTVAATKTVRVDDLPARVRDNVLAFLRKRITRVSACLLAVLGEALTHYGFLLKLITG